MDGEWHSTSTDVFAPRSRCVLPWSTSVPMSSRWNRSATCDAICRDIVVERSNGGTLNDVSLVVRSNLCAWTRLWRWRKLVVVMVVEKRYVRKLNGVVPPVWNRSWSVYHDSGNVFLRSTWAENPLNWKRGVRVEATLYFRLLSR